MSKCAITELTPSNSRKSFYGRAKVIESKGSHFLRSYNTVVAGVDRSGKVHRYWDGKTKTTSSHILSFLDQFSDMGCGRSTKAFYDLPLEKTPSITVTL